MLERKIQCYSNTNSKLKNFYCKGEKNPCSCGGNTFHYEYDTKNNTMYGVCDSCNEDIYIIKDEYIKGELEKGFWKLKE